MRVLFVYMECTALQEKHNVLLRQVLECTIISIITENSVISNETDFFCLLA